MCTNFLLWWLSENYSAWSRNFPRIVNKVNDELMFYNNNEYFDTQIAKNLHISVIKGSSSIQCKPTYQSAKNQLTRASNWQMERGHTSMLSTHLFTFFWKTTLNRKLKVLDFSISKFHFLAGNHNLNFSFRSSTRKLKYPYQLHSMYYLVLLEIVD